MTPENNFSSSSSMAEMSPLITQEINDFITAHEMLQERLIKREKALEEQIEACEFFLNEQIEKVNALMADIRDTMTETGAARLRLSAQEALKLGTTQVNTLRKLGEETRLTMQESCARFERTTHSTIKHLNEVTQSFKLEDFQQFVENTYQKVNNTTTGIMEKISTLLRWFQWKNLLFGLAVAIVTAVFMGLYLNDEWPWEMHQEVIKQRAAGKALMNAWVHLSPSDQAYLQKRIAQAQKKS